MKEVTFEGGDRIQQGELLVKLDQFDPNDRERVCIRTAESAWLPGLVDGLTVLPLHEFGVQHTALVR